MIELAKRHATVVMVSLVLMAAFWQGRMDWDPEMRLWRAVGDTSLILLYAALAIGPAIRLFRGRVLGSLLPLRRPMGIWFGVLAFAHAALVWDGWARWDVDRLLGYEFIPRLGRLARLEPGFGLANLLGIAALLITLPLLVTSADWAVTKLGRSTWKFLHYGTYIVFWLVVLHTAYFLFMHYTPSFHRPVPPDANWFQMPFVGLTVLVVVLQTAAFTKTVLQQRSRLALRSANAKPALNHGRSTAVARGGPN